MKFFAWGSEAEQQEIMKSLGYTPVPLEPTDILPSIQTGMINVVPSTPYFALASQIYNTAPNMLEINWAPIVGAFVITKNRGMKCHQRFNLHSEFHRKKLEL